MKARIRNKPTQREIRNLRTFYAGGTTMEAPKPRGRQPEGLVNDEIAAWRNQHHDLVLARNKRLVVTMPNGDDVLLGWVEDGSSDWIGYRSVLITPSMVGQRIAQFFAIEAKSDSGSLSTEQEKFLNDLNDAGGRGGMVKGHEDARDQCQRIWEGK